MKNFVKSLGIKNISLPLNRKSYPTTHHFSSKLNKIVTITSLNRGLPPLWRPRIFSVWKSNSRIFNFFSTVKMASDSDEKSVEGKCSICLVTIPDKDVEDLSDKLLEKRLVACVNTMSVKSKYVWKGKIVKDDEILMIMKTETSKVKELIDFVTKKGNHPYEVPEVISYKIDKGNKSYLDWIVENVS